MLEQLGVRRLLLAIHDVSFPSDPDEDLGRGSPATKAAARLMAYAKELGFTGLQLGPQGQTSRDNPSPYDAMIFSRSLSTIGVEAYRGLVDDETITGALFVESAVAHVHAFDASHALVAAAHAAIFTDEQRAELAAFQQQHARWLAGDALYTTLATTHGGAAHRDWPSEERDVWAEHSPLDRYAASKLVSVVAALDEMVTPSAATSAATLREKLVAQLDALKLGEPEACARAAELADHHAVAIERYAFGQLLAHREHARVRTIAAELGLALYGDLAVGYADADAWAYSTAFLRGYRMGAPPSRTNPMGQPWGYPVLDPDQAHGRSGALVAARADKAFAEYGGLRIDHPHGIICPWVYKTETGDDGQAVRDGARLFESPDLPDHPDLVKFARVLAEQLDRSLPRYADGWVKKLEDFQVTAYARTLEMLVTAARDHARSAEDLSCEVLSTMPRPLGAVLAKYGLGRWRVAQKANLDDAGDVYRMENAQPNDWVMLGNHDTAPIFALIKMWSPTQREAWARHLAVRLALPDPTKLEHDGFVANAMLAELLASRAENVSIFFADLFGYEQRFNVPGVIDNTANWSLRLPPDFDRLHRERLERGAALDLHLACELALNAGTTPRRAGAP